MNKNYFVVVLSVIVVVLSLVALVFLKQKFTDCITYFDSQGKEIYKDCKAGE